MIDWISRRAEKLTLDRGRLRDPEFRVLRKVFLPRNRPGSLKQVLKCLCMEAADFQEYALCCSEENIGAADRLRIADKRHTAILHLTDLISEILDLLFHDCLQTEMAWDD